MEPEVIVRPRSNLPSYVVVLAFAAMAQPAHADSPWVPTGAFFQVGVGENAESATAGLSWRWSRQWALGSGVISGSWAAAISGWQYRASDGMGDSHLWQLSLTPIVRYTPAGGSSPWFIEGGIGATYTDKIYVTEGKAFSTRFNFGDQIAIGATFGPAREYEVSLRFEHFSNAGIKRPNPGENFVQLRLAVPLR